VCYTIDTLMTDTGIRCEGCNKPLKPDDDYVMSDTAKVYHRVCYSKDIICNYCGGPIIGQLKQVLDKNYHTKCWICTGCSKNLANDPFHENNGWPYCGYCAKNEVWLRGKKTLVLADPEKEAERQDLLRKMRELQARFAAGHKMQISVADGAGGFTVNPVTGEKKDSHHPVTKK